MRVAVVLEGLSVIEATGRDRLKVLHNLCTAEVARLTPGLVREAFFTDVKGRTVGHGLIAEMDDRTLIVGSPAHHPALMPHLDRYVIREQVEWSDLTLELSAWLVSAAGDLAEELGTADCGAIMLGSVRVPAIRATWTSDADLLFFGTTEQRQQIEQELMSRGISIGTVDAFHTARVNHGWPWFGVDFDAKNLPQEVDRDAQAICFTKGCYLGQETVARLDALGQVQRKLLKWTIATNEPMELGTSLMAGDKVIGEVRSSAPAASDPQSRVALVMTRRSHFDLGSRATTTTGTVASR